MVGIEIKITDELLFKRAIRKLIPAAYQNARLQDFSDKIIVSFSRYGYLIRGQAGVGKTHYATAIAISCFNHLSPNFIGDANEHGVLLANIPAIGFRWQHVPHLYCRLRSTFGNQKGETEYDIVNEMIEYRLLLLDDFGAEKISDYSVSAFYTILSQRRNQNKPTIITTNLNMDEIESIDSRIASRLGEFIQIVLSDKDRRLR